MFLTASSAQPVLATAALALLLGCSEPRCPDGYTQIGNSCRRNDAGEAAMAGGDDSEDDSGSPSGDVGSSGGATGMSGDSDAAAMHPNGALQTLPDGGDAGARLADCLDGQSCGAGFMCVAMRCVSACAQNQCDPNATCSAIGHAAACTCNRGFINVADAGEPVSCVRDVACEDLGCDVNAECQSGSDQVRRCVCKSGYTGNGRVCAPVTCLPPTIANGRAFTPEGTTLGKVATYTCNSGYEFASMVPSVSRSCGPEGSWGAEVPTCVAKQCPPLSIAFGTADMSRGRAYGSPPVTFSCQSGFVRLGPAMAECQADGTWTAVPKCLGCGDGEVSNVPGLIEEQCDPMDKRWNIWTCGNNCRTATVYTKCASSPCNPGEMCNPNMTFCTPTQQCTSAANCPLAAGKQALCLAGHGLPYCFPPCASSKDCAPGLQCRSNGAIKYCYDCTTIEGLICD